MDFSLFTAFQLTNFYELNSRKKNENFSYFRITNTSLQIKTYFIKYFIKIEYKILKLNIETTYMQIKYKISVENRQFEWNKNEVSFTFNSVSVEEKL